METRDFVAGATPSVQSEMKLIFELGDLIKLQAASPVYTLQQLAKLEAVLKYNDTHRKHLLETAKLAVQIAHSEFTRARHAARQRTSKGGGEAINPAPTIHLADIKDLRKYAERSLRLTERLETSHANFGALQHIRVHHRHAVEGFKAVIASVVRGGPESEMMEIRWAVERKCMYWDAVAMMKARIGEAARVDEVSQRPRRHSR